MNYRTPLAHVLASGSAKKGTRHWWQQRLSALVLIPLTFWMMAFIKQLSHANHAQISAWLTEPLNSLFAISFVLVTFFHVALGLQVVIEDYIQNKVYKLITIWLIKLSLLFLGLLTMLFILQIVLQ